MKIVIDIPEEYYEEIENMPHFKRNYAQDLILDGTPLPKCHGRLIDADKTIQKICGSSCGCHLEECGHDEPCFSVTRIESAPTIIEADTESEG